MVQRPDGNPTPSLLTQLAASPPSRPRARPPSVLLLHLPALFHLHLSSLLLVVYLLPRLLSPLSLSLSLILPISCYLRFFPLLSSPFLSPILHALTEEDPFFYSSHSFFLFPLPIIFFPSKLSPIRLHHPASSLLLPPGSPAFLVALLHLIPAFFLSTPLASSYLFFSYFRSLLPPPSP